jgi:tetratricopeptide (TPR) repeat protein
MAASDVGDVQLAHEVLERVATRATELGARWERALACDVQGDLFREDPQRRLARHREAERLFSEVGELDNVAASRWNQAIDLVDLGLKREALRTLDEAAGLFRRLGVRGRVVQIIGASAVFLDEIGELDAAGKRLDENRAELEELGVPRDSFLFVMYFLHRARRALDAADLDAAREDLRRARQGRTEVGYPELLEASVLTEEDQGEQARAAFLRAASLAKPGQNRTFSFAAICAFDCDGDQPTDGLACLAERCRPGQPGFEGLQDALCQLEEARCSFRANDLARAERAARGAWAFFETRDDYEQRVRTHGLLMRVAAARGETAPAIRALRTDLAEVESKHHRRLVFEITLALGDAELRAGRVEGRTRLLKLEKEAKSRDFFRIARLAREALQQNPMAGTRPQQ